MNAVGTGDVCLDEPLVEKLLDRIIIASAPGQKRGPFSPYGDENKTYHPDFFISDN